MVSKSTSVSVLLILISTLAFAQHIYKWKDKTGQWHFSDTPPAEVKAERMRGLDSPPKSSPPTNLPTMPTSPSPSEQPSQPVWQSQAVKPQRPSSLQKIIVPFTRDGGHIVVEGIVNGRDRVKFILDTGAEGTLIPFDLVQRSGVNIDKAVLMPHRGIGGVVWEPEIDIDSLRVGDAEVRNLGVTIVRRGMLVEARRGLLGANFLDDFRIDIRYDQKVVTLERVKGPYAGYPAEWWQKRFRYYQNLKQLYLFLYKETGIRMTSHLMQRCQIAQQAGAPSPYECRIQKALRVVEAKLSDLDLRAYHAGVPRDFRR